MMTTADGEQLVFKVLFTYHSETFQKDYAVFYNEKDGVFSISPEIWSVLDRKNKAALTQICNPKIKDYFKD